jgi:hypothetical protein
MSISKLKRAIFQIDKDENFNDLSLEVFQYQRKNCAVYHEWLAHLSFPDPNHYSEIPFLPISFFKTHLVLDGTQETPLTFLSSGTTQQVRSKHKIVDPSLYEVSFTKAFELFFGNARDFVVLALLPNYIEQGNSSLVFMVDALISQSQSPLSGFYLNDLENLHQTYLKAIEEGKKVIVFGVSYALMDLADLHLDFSSAIFIETGGMKGRRKEMDKAGLHQYLRDGLNNPQISSEYGMTELLSQGYSLLNGVFYTPPWMKILIRETNDPFSLVKDIGKTGGINVIDLANLHSCAFIATEDLGKLNEDGGFTLQGRFDHSDVRGCNLMVF